MANKVVYILWSITLATAVNNASQKF